MKKLRVRAWPMLLCLAVGALLGYNEWQYHLPTPVPPNYRPLNTGTRTNLNAQFDTHQGKPVFLHFFNPDYPCSRSNFSSFKSMASQYGRQVNFVAVVMDNHYYTARGVQDKFSLNIPELFGASLAMASNCSKITAYS